MNFTAIVLCIVCFAVSLVECQFGSFGYWGNAFSGGLDAALSARDPRQNPGPVVFPPSPPDNGETSGVVVGASGYGFVPPNSPRGPGTHGRYFSFF